MHSQPRVLFILKLRHQYGGDRALVKSSGLLNSATFVRDMLADEGVATKLIQVVDNNCIDREVTRFRPDVVIIEALWIVPEKFAILRKRHPNVKWIVRVHSEVPFLANEGPAMGWLTEYARHPNVYVSLNAANTLRDFVRYFDSIDPSGHLADTKLIYLPNYYPVTDCAAHTPFSYIDGVINVGCFGSLRPMKNQLIQAFAAVEFARKHELKLNFHINSGRMDNFEGGAVLKNLRAFFHALPHQFKLVEHEWLDRDDFLDVVAGMDIGLQTSLTETFNIVTADFVNEGVPIVVSHEVDWMPRVFMVNPTNVNSIVRGMDRALFIDRWLPFSLSRVKLARYVERNKQEWIGSIADLCCNS